MSTPLKIKVTKDILEKAKNNRGWCATKTCPIALVLKDIFPDAEVNIQFIKLNESFKIATPEKVVKFIFVYDWTIPLMRPSMPELEFTIDIPDEVIEKIDIESLRPLLINHPTLQLL